MVDQLSGPVVLPDNGKPSRAIVFLHGYGSNGNDLISLAPVLKDIFPDMAFFSPDAPHETVMGEGYQWFNDNEWTFVDRPGIGDAADLIEDYIYQIVKGEHGIPLDRVVIVGFSQGAMTALFTAPRLREKIAGVVSYSGVIMWQDELISMDYQQMPITIMHNQDDEVVISTASDEIHQQLEELGFEDLELNIFPKGGHGINDEGLKTTIEFIQRVLP